MSRPVRRVSPLATQRQPAVNSKASTSHPLTRVESLSQPAKATTTYASSSADIAANASAAGARRSSPPRRRKACRVELPMRGYRHLRGSAEAPFGSAGRRDEGPIAAVASATLGSAQARSPIRHRKRVRRRHEGSAIRSLRRGRRSRGARGGGSAGRPGEVLVARQGGRDQSRVRSRSARGSCTRAGRRRSPRARAPTWRASCALGRRGGRVRGRRGGARLDRAAREPRRARRRAGRAARRQAGALPWEVAGVAVRGVRWRHTRRSRPSRRRPARRSWSRPPPAGSARSPCSSRAAPGRR